jgi:hypothetical protein
MSSLRNFTLGALSLFPAIEDFNFSVRRRLRRSM